MHQGDEKRGKVDLSRGSHAMMALSKILQHVYIPLEETQGRQDNLQNLKKFVSQISHTIQQVTGTVTIKLPAADNLDDDQAYKNQDLMRKYEILVDEWTSIIKKTIKDEDLKKPEPRKSLELIEHWRAKSAVLSTLYQQLSMPIVGTVLKVIN